MLTYRPPIVISPAARHTATVIFAHGLGDSGHGWVSAVENWRRRQRLSEVKFVLPHAASVPVTCNGGMRMPAWYDIITLDGTLEGFFKRPEDEPGMLATRDYFRQLIQAEVAAGIPEDRIVLGGFSQGGAMALFTGLTNPRRLAGIMALSTYLALVTKIDLGQYIPPAGQPNPTLGTPILMCHGTVDPVVPTAMGNLSKEKLVKLGYSVDWKLYPGMPHSACPAEMDDVEAFLRKVLPPAPDAGKSEL